MPRKVYLVIALVCATAAFAVTALFAVQPPPPARWLAATLCMAGWGIVAQVLGHQLGRASAISIASIPYLTALYLVPRVEVVALAAIGEAVIGILRRRETPKAVFNVAQVALAVSIGAITFTALGGRPLLEPGKVNIVAYAAASAAVFIANNACVSFVIAVSENRSVRSVLYLMTKGSIVNNVLSLPLPYLFGRLFVTRGVWGAVLLAVPLIAVRQVFLTAWKLETVTQDLLQLMVKAIEARDPYTSGHSQRVQAYASLIGRMIGLSTRQVERLSQAALLHDVGKIHEIYAPILRKPDKLSPAEWALMETHPIKSAELVSAVSHLKDIVPSIRHHHENWNGTGYPDHVAGETIPLFARIIAIADTVDAMTTDRPYRRALPTEVVRQELISMAGAQFDPKLCEAIMTGTNFEKLVSSIRANAARGRSTPDAVLRAV
ncbi:MAG TPA: HD-GYP domain-containing protein [Gemmatimonadaceae bacterium]|nr:HD-GYP domain-containing protein [Gemmatimonadaceae bacterium]